MRTPLADAARAAPQWLPFGVLAALGLLVGALASGAAGLGVVIVGLLLLSRPFEPFRAFVLVACACAFVAYGDPNLQRDLAIVTLLSVYGAISLLGAWLSGRWAWPTSRLTTALTALGVTTAIGMAHGVLVHTPFRFNVLETFPLATLFIALVVGGLRLRVDDLPFATRLFVAAALVNSLIGFHYYATAGMRTQGLPFSPFPGFVALLMLGQQLFSPSKPRMLVVAAMCVMLMHQVATFTRGYWLGLLIAIPVTCLLYARWGSGAGARWRRVGAIGARAGLVVIPAVVVAASQFGWSELATMLGSRFASSFETRNTPETLSNIVRLVELRTTMNRIAESPLFGFGHGATILVRQFFYPMAGAQWWIHQSYAMIWYKQGIIGVVALLWVLFTAYRTSARGCRNERPEFAGWCAGSAGCTVFVAIVGLTNYTFFMTTLTAILGLVWGVALAASRPLGSRWVWRLRGAAEVGGPPPVS